MVTKFVYNYFLKTVDNTPTKSAMWKIWDQNFYNLQSCGLVYEEDKKFDQFDHLVLTGVGVSNFFIYSNFDLIFNTQNKCIDLKPGYVKKILVSPSPNHSKKLSMLYVILAFMPFLIIFRFVGSLKGRLTDRQEGRKLVKRQADTHLDWQMYRKTEY